MRLAVGRTAAAALTAATLAWAGPGPAAARGLTTGRGQMTARPASAPTTGQIARAVARASASRSLWATINICQTGRTGDVIGVRGQMPALGLRSTMVMTIVLDAWSASSRRFVRVRSPNAVNHVALGAPVSGLQQGGAEFPFRAGSTGLWRATVTFAWIRAGRLIGRTTRTTTGGHPSADYSIPPHHSAATCRFA